MAAGVAGTSAAAAVAAEADERSCWVCFGTDEDNDLRDGWFDSSGGWLQPCQCRNTTKWVHQACLQRWIDEKQRGNPSTLVSCPQCNYQYVIVFPPQSKFISLLEKIEQAVQKACPFVAATFATGAVYWTIVSYGAFTIMQIFGSREGLELIEKGDPLFLLVGMPAIPVALILGKLVRWEDLVLKLWRKHSKKLMTMFYGPPMMDNGAYPARAVARDPVEAAIMSDPISATRVLCGALVLPTISMLCGRVVFRRIESNLQRTVMGGIAFIIVKGVLKMYYRQQQFMRTLGREIRNYLHTPPRVTSPPVTPSPTRSSGDAPPAAGTSVGVAVDADQPLTPTGTMSPLGSHHGITEATPLDDTFTNHTIPSSSDEGDEDDQEEQEPMEGENVELR